MAGSDDGARLEALARVPLFADLDKRELEMVDRASKEIHRPDGTDIVREGEDGIGFHLILSGTAQVTRSGEVVRELGPGDYFGEIALIDGGKRSATVTATSDLTLASLSHWEFMPLVRENPEVAVKLLVGLAAMFRQAIEA